MKNGGKRKLPSGPFFVVSGIGCLVSNITPGFYTRICPAMEYRLFSKNELARYDGKNGAPAYIAYRGSVYDVSRSFLWLGGRHQVLHDAGIDLTAELADAPHTADVLDKFPIVGLLQP